MLSPSNISAKLSHRAVFQNFCLGLSLILCLAGNVPELNAQSVAYVTNQSPTGQPTGTVTVLDTSTNTISATIPVGGSPGPIIASPDGSLVYAANSGPGVAVIDTATNTVVGNIPVGPRSMAITPDGTRIYSLDGSEVDIIDTATNTVVGPPITVPNGPIALAMAPDGAHVYVAQVFGATLSAIDTATNSLVGTPLFLQALCLSLAVTPDGKQVYAGCEASIVIVDVASNSVVAQINQPEVPGGGETMNFGIAITPDGTKAYAVDVITNTVEVINTATRTMEGPLIAVTGEPESLAITPDSKRVYVPGGFFVGAATVIDTATNTVVNPSVPVGPDPSGITIFNLNAPFAQFHVNNFNILDDQAPTGHAVVSLSGTFIPGANSNGIDPVHQAVTLEIGNFSLFIPAGSFHASSDGLSFKFTGLIKGVSVEFAINAQQNSNGGPTAFAFQVKAQEATITEQKPVLVVLKLANNTGSESVQGD